MGLVSIVRPSSITLGTYLIRLDTWLLFPWICQFLANFKQYNFFENLFKWCWMTKTKKTSRLYHHSFQFWRIDVSKYLSKWGNGNFRHTYPWLYLGKKKCAWEMTLITFFKCYVSNLNPEFEKILSRDFWKNVIWSFLPYKAQSD